MNDDEHGRHEPEDDEVAALLRLAGKREAAPDDVRARVRAAVEAEWRRRVRERRRRRLLWPAAGLAAAVTLVALLRAPGISGPASRTLATEPVAVAATAADPAMVVELQTGGDVTLSTGTGALGEDAPHRLRRGDRIPVGGTVRTGGESRAAFRLDDHSLRLDRGSAVRRLGPRVLAIEQGAVYVDSGARTAAAAPGVELVTPAGRVRELGTQFEVRIGPGAVLVRLREGEVVIERGAEQHRVGSGTELTLAADGSARRRSLPAWAAEWDWLEAATPMIELQGKTARAFLDWAARERGLALAFSGSEVAREADRIVLGGGVEGLTVDQALAAVLPSCRMVHRVEAGRLQVSPAP